MRLPATLTLTIVAATVIGTLADAGTLAHAAGSPAVDYGATWTVDTTANSLSEFAPGASGAATAIATIKGSATGLSAPSAVTVSTGGTVFVANAGNNSITEYPNGATGNTPAIATIKGSDTGLHAPTSITLSGGELWVTNPSTNVVEAFTSGSAGNELPAETIAGSKTLLNHPVGVAIDSEAADFDEPGVAGLGDAGFEIYVINAPTSGSGNITAYSSDRLGDVAPGVTVTTSSKHPLQSPTAILSRGFGELWVADGATDTLSDLVVLAPEAGEPAGTPTSEPVRTIAGTKTGIDTPSGLAINPLGQLVEANAGDHSVRVFAANAKGDVAPIRTVTGLGATAGSPAAAVVLGAAPSAPTDFKVAIHRSARAATATLSWKPPTTTGGGITDYRAVAVNVTELVGTGVPPAVIKQFVEFGAIGAATAGGTNRHTTATKKLKLGRSYVFGVIAVNAFGASQPSHLVERTLAVAATAPQKVKTSSSKHSISVHWDAPKSDGGLPVTAYRIEYGACVPGSKGCRSHALVVGAKRRFATIRGLTPGTTYDVRIAAKTKHGLGALSPNRTAVPLA